MVRRIIGGTALAGALTLGVAGMAGAGAATPSSATGGSTTPAACSRLPKLEARVQKFENAVKARLPKAEAREAKLKAAGHDKLANAIATRITKVQAREAKINARLSKAEAKCGSSGSSDSSAEHGEHPVATRWRGSQPGRSLSSSAASRESPSRSSGWTMPAVAAWASAT